MSCTCLTYIFWIHLHTWDTCTVRQSQCCSVLTALGVHEQPTRITMHYWQNQLQDSRGAGSQCCLHSWLQGAKLCQPHTSLGCRWPPSGLWWPPPLGLAPSSPRARAQQKSSQKVSLLSERYRRQRRIFALEARCNNKRGFIRKTNTFLLSFLSALEGFLKASFGAGWRVRGGSGGKLCPAPLLLLPPPRNSPFVPILVQ